MAGVHTGLTHSLQPRSEGTSSSSWWDGRVVSADSVGLSDLWDLTVDQRPVGPYGQSSQDESGDVTSEEL